MELAFPVIGTPAAQGSKRHLGNGVLVEQSKNVTPWRNTVAAAAHQALLAQHPHIAETGLAAAAGTVPNDSCH